MRTKAGTRGWLATSLALHAVLFLTVRSASDEPDRPLAAVQVSFSQASVMQEALPAPARRAEADGPTEQTPRLRRQAKPSPERRRSDAAAAAKSTVTRERAMSAAAEPAPSTGPLPVRAGGISVPAAALQAPLAGASALKLDAGTPAFTSPGNGGLRGMSAATPSRADTELYATTSVRLPSFSSARVQSGGKPDYPAEARRRGLEGDVKVRMTVLPDGRVEPQIIGSSGSDLLDRAALQAAGRWRFQPARGDGEAVEDQVNVVFRFRLEESGR